MKIACLYFPTSSVGGIATNTAALRDEAARRGDRLDVLVCDSVGRHVHGTIPRKRIRGGDTYIDIDGYAPHHPTNWRASVKWLVETYDLVYLAYLCPHPTKSYIAPDFAPLLESLALFMPIVGRISDGYWSTYRDWGLRAARTCSRMVVAVEAYLPPDLATECPRLPIVYGRPFDPEPMPLNLLFPEQDRVPHSVVWIAQWKAIKGIHRFLPMVADIEAPVNLYSNGILYYQKRTEPDWIASIGEDKFQGFNGCGRATFHGWQPPAVIREALAHAWFMPEFQGLGKPKHEAYRRGATNNTTMEALFCECTPVIPQSVIDGAGIPPESAIGVRDWGDILPALQGPRAARPDLGREWVMDNFRVSMIYDRFFGGLL